MEACIWWFSYRDSLLQCLLLRVWEAHSVARPEQTTGTASVPKLTSDPQEVLHFQLFPGPQRTRVRNWMQNLSKEQFQHPFFKKSQFLFIGQTCFLKIETTGWRGYSTLYYDGFYPVPLLRCGPSWHSTDLHEQPGSPTPSTGAVDSVR